MAEDADASLGQRAGRAVGWSFANTALSRLGTLAIGIALARILGPEEYGIFAIALLTQLAILSFNELGVSLAVVRWPDAPARIVPTVNTVAVTSSALLTAAVVLGAEVIATALGNVAAAPVIQVLGISILINGLVATPAAVLQREFMAGRRMVADQVNTWLGAFVSLALALVGWGAMSIAIGRIVGSVAAAVLFLRWSPVPYRFGRDAEVARRLLPFGLPLAAASIVVFASGYADQFVVGTVLGSTAIGFYSLAFNLSNWPVSVFSGPLRQVAPATFARLQHDPERQRSTLLGVATVLMAVALPACLAIAGAARPVIGFLYGVDWLPAAAVLVWLALVAALRIWFELSYDWLVILDRGRALLVIQVVWLVCSVPAMLWGATQAGVAGVAAGQFAVAGLVVLPSYVWLLRRAHVPLGALARALWLPLLGGAAAFAGAAGISALPLPNWAASVLAGLWACTVIAALLLRHRGLLRLLRPVSPTTDTRDLEESS